MLYAYNALPLAEQVNLFALVFFFCVGIITLAIFSLRWKQRRRDQARSRGGTVITAEFFREYFFFITFPFLKLCEIARLSPNTISAFSLFLGFVAAGSIAAGWFFWGGWALAFSGMVDTLDGQIARLTGKVSARGAYLDSVFDRYADFAVFSAFLFYFGTGLSEITVVSGYVPAAAALAALTGAALISYVKERGANLGVRDERGLMQRADRLLITCVMCIYDPAALLFAGMVFDEQQNNRYLTLIGLSVMAIVSHASAINRLRRIAKQLQ